MIYLRPKLIEVPKMNYKKSVYQQNKLNKIPGIYSRKFTKKDLPKIQNKTVPLHFISANPTYNAKFTQVAWFQKWAQIPFSPSKQKKQATQLKNHSISEQISTKLNKAKSLTSQLFTKKYLKRKQRFFSRDSTKDYLSISQSIVRNQGKKQNRIINRNLYLDDDIQLDKKNNDHIHLISSYHKSNQAVTESSIIYKKSFKQYSKLNLSLKRENITKNFFKNIVQKIPHTQESQNNI